MKKVIVAIMIFVLSAFAFGQQRMTRDADCVRPFYFSGTTTSGVSLAYDNRSTACTTWTLVYNSVGYSALSIEYDVAPDSNGQPGTFATATILASGTLPLTATTQGQITGYKYFPWLNIKLNSTTGTGQISGVLYGYRAFSGNDSSSFGGSQVQGMTAAGSTTSGNPVLVGGTDSGNLTRSLSVNNSGVIATIGSFNAVDGDANLSGKSVYDSGASTAVLLVRPELFNGATWDRPFYCPNTSTFSVASTITQIVAISGSTKIRICSASLNPTTSTAGSVDIVYGTGSSCGTGTTTLTGAFTLPASAVVNIPVPITAQGALITPTGQAVCIRTVTSTVAGFITWAQY